MIFDFHNDIITSCMNLDDKLEYVTKQLLHARGLVLALWTSKQKLSVAQVNQILQPFVDLVASADNLFFGIEDINLTTDNITDIATLPFVSYGLVHNQSNQYAGSCFDSDNIGLTDKGVHLTKELQKHKKIIDTAHCSQRGFYDILDATKGESVVCSHTCFAQVNNHVRNLSVDQCRHLVSCGGIVGLTLVKEFLGGDDLDVIVRHIDWFASKFGTENLALGTDYFGTSLPKCLDNYDKFENLHCAIQKLGYKDAEINNIFFKNLQRYLTARLS